MLTALLESLPSRVSASSEGTESNAKGLRSVRVLLFPSQQTYVMEKLAAKDLFIMFDSSSHCDLRAMDIGPK